jgi:hypothetical protein
MGVRVTYVACLLLVCLLQVQVGLGYTAVESGPTPTVEELQSQLRSMEERVAALQAELAALRARLDPLGGQAAAPDESEAELTDLIAAAEREAAVEAPPSEQEARTTFTSGALGLQALNPEMSVTGDFLAAYRSGEGLTRHFDAEVRTLEVAFDSYLDPYSRMRAIVEFGPEGAELGEAYFMRYGLRPNLNVTLGKFRQQFGVVNRWHKHSLDQFDFPLPIRQIFGPGGLNQTGVAIDWQLPPLDTASQHVTLQLTNGENPRLFANNTRNMPSALLRYSNYRDLSKDAYLELGLTALAGRNDEWPVLGPLGELTAQRRDLWTSALGADVTVLWEPTGEMRYRNWLWRTEYYQLRRGVLAPDGSGPDTLRAWGAYSQVQSRLSRTLDAGLHLDYYEPDVRPYADLPGLSLSPHAVTESGAHQWLIAPYLTWHQSPCVRWHLEWNHLRNHLMGPDEDAIILQCCFAAGPHKHERY